MKRETKGKVIKGERSKRLTFSVRLKILIPVLIVLILSISAISVYSYNNQREIIKQQMAMVTRNKMDEIIGSIHNNEEGTKLLRQALNNNYLKQAKIVSQLIAQNPALLETEALTKLAKEVGVDEICVIDEKGIIRWSNIVDFIGFDCNTSDQTIPFLAGISDKSFELAQEPSFRGTDGTYFQYIGVARIDSPGVVQIGVHPEELVKLTDNNDVQTLISNVRLGRQAQVYILDMEGNCKAHTNTELIGKNVSETDWGKEILENKKGDITYVYDGEEKFASYSELDGEILAVCVSTSDFFGSLEGLKKASVISAVISVIVSIVIIFVASNKFIIKAINEIMELMMKAEKGDLSVKSKNKQKDEIGKLSNSFNKMISDFGNLVKEVKEISGDVNAFSANLAEASEATSAIGEQVTNAVEEVAKGASDQARDAEQVLELTVNLAQQIDTISERSENMNEKLKNTENLNTQGVGIVSELITSSEESNKYTLDAFDVITQLDEKSNNIFDIIQLINGISEQTNLLALNAAIEAARAGEAGKGFAVVSDEIRNLADQSQQSTKQIEDIINDITSDIKKASNNMESVKSKLEEQANHAEKTENIFKMISEAIQDVVKSIKDVNESIYNAGDSKNQIVMSMQNISAITEETAAATEEVSASAEEYSASSEKVSAIASQLNDIVIKLEEKINQFHI